MSGRSWTESEIKLLKELYPHYRETREITSFFSIREWFSFVISCFNNIIRKQGENLIELCAGYSGYGCGVGNVNFIIQKVRIDKETSKSVWIEGKRYSKLSKLFKELMFFDSFEEARKYLISIHELSVELSKNGLTTAEKRLKQVSIKNPDMTSD